jgi:hypothetical protein
MTRFSRNFYLFLGFHSFLLGLFPFFLPVYLFKQGVSLAGISWFIALTGVGFSLTLWVLDHTRSKSCLVPVALSFSLEGCLLLLLLSEAPLPLIALVNGGYSCLYWTIQRVLFLAGGGSEDSGRRFGNFQIYVLLILKAGIFIGSILLENIGVWAVGILTLLVGSSGIGVLWTYGRGLQFSTAMQQQKPLGLLDLVRFSDSLRSRWIFAMDGIFLYLESYFWLISLFIVVGESFVRLGVLVIVLAILLGLLFYFIKNKIDRFRNQRVYICAVFLYIASWGLRAALSGEMNYSFQLCLLMVIAFFTSFFRLAFNKRFFDNALRSSTYQYLFMKSYYSQLFLAIGFGLIGCWMASVSGDLDALRSFYWGVGIAAVGYLFYLPARTANGKGRKGSKIADLPSLQTEEKSATISR